MSKYLNHNEDGSTVSQFFSRIVSMQETNRYKRAGEIYGFWNPNIKGQRQDQPVHIEVGDGHTFSYPVRTYTKVEHNMVL